MLWVSVSVLIVHVKGSNEANGATCMSRASDNMISMYATDRQGYLLYAKTTKPDLLKFHENFRKFSELSNFCHVRPASRTK